MTDSKRPSSTGPSTPTPPDVGASQRSPREIIEDWLNDLPDAQERAERIYTKLQQAGYVLVRRSDLGLGYRCAEESMHCDEPPVDHDWYCAMHMGYPSQNAPSNPTGASDGKGS